MMRKVLKKENLLFLFIASVAIFPILALLLYVQPSSKDEFNYFFNAYKDTVSFWLDYYIGSTGRYSLTPFVYVFNPLNMGFEYSKYLHIFFSFIFISSIFYSIYILFKNIFHNTIKKKDIILIPFIFVCIFLNSVAGLGDWIYWFVGAIAYVLPTVLYVFFCAQFVKCIIIDNISIFDKVKLYILLFLSMGGHELINIFQVLVVGYFWLNAYLTNSKYQNILFHVLLFSILCSFILFLAPGNFNRLAVMDKLTQGEESMRYAFKPLWKIVIITSYFTICNIGNWLSNGFIYLFLLMVFPVMLKLEKKYAWHQSIRLHPILFSFLLFFIIFLAHFIMVRANHYPIDRIMALLFFLFFIGILVNFQLFIAYLNKGGLFKSIEENIFFYHQNYIKYLATFILFLSILPSNYNINSAYYELFLVAPQFDKFNQERFSKITRASKNKEKSVTITKTPPHLRSKFLIREDFESTHDRYTQTIAKYFLLDKIEVVEK